MNSEIRVLHVDDEPVICDLTKHTLEKGGRLKVDVVHSAEEALDLIRSGTYSCIISDYEMPIMNGLDFLKEVRDIDKEIPFILFSGRGREAVIIDAINTGADFYIQKGGEPKALFAELNHKVEYAIQQRSTRIALKRRDGILEAVSLVANLFLGGEPFDRALQEAITLFGLATEVDVVRLFQLDTETPSDTSGHYLKNIASWTRIPIHNPEQEAIIRTTKLPLAHPCMDRLIRGETLILNSSEVILFDPCKGANNAKSVAVFPVFVDHKVWGIFWFADYLGERNWTSVEIDALLAASAMTGSAIQQDRMRTSLITAKEEYASMYALMRRLCDTVPDILWAKDTDGTYLFVNQAGSELLHAKDTREPVGKKEQDFPYGIIRHTPVTGSEQDQLRNSEKRITVHSKAGLTDLDIITVPFVNSDGNRIGTVTLGRDVTRFCQVEDELRQSHERYESIIKSIHLGVLIVDKDGIIQEINPRALELLNTTREKIVGILLNQNRILREMEISDVIHEVIQSNSSGISFLASRTVTKTSEDLYCMVKRLVPENGESTEVLITLDPHYSR